MPTTIEIPIQGDEGLKALTEGDEANLLVNGTVEANDGNILTLYVNQATVSDEAPAEEEPVEEELEEGTTDEEPTITRTKAVVAKPAGPPPGLAAMMKRGA